MIARFSRRNSGFTLIELMVVVAIIGLLAAVAIPAYENFTMKAKFTEVINAAGPAKIAISACVSEGDCVSGGAVAVSPTGYNTYADGTSGALVDNIPCAGPSDDPSFPPVIGCAPRTKYTYGVLVFDNGMIESIGDPDVFKDPSGITYFLTPTYSGGRVDWAASGSCKTRAGGALC